jgi:hypothetical protein
MKSKKGSKKFFNLRDKVKQLDLSFECVLKNKPDTLQTREIVLPSLLTRKKLDEDIEMLSRL